MSKDWERHHAALWAKNSAKFTKLTPRMREQPVIEVFNSHPQNGADKTIFWMSAVLLVILAGVGLFNKFCGG